MFVVVGYVFRGFYYILVFGLRSFGFYLWGLPSIAVRFGMGFVMCALRDLASCCAGLGLVYDGGSCVRVRVFCDF